MKMKKISPNCPNGFTVQYEFWGRKMRLILKFATKNGHKLRSYKIHLRIFAPDPSNREEKNN